MLSNQPPPQELLLGRPTRAAGAPEVDAKVKLALESSVFKCETANALAGKAILVLPYIGKAGA